MQYSIIYNGNGNTGGNVPSSGIYNVGDVATISSSNLTKTGYKFIGWNTSADGSGISYPVGYQFEMEDDLLYLYAYWIKQSDERRFGGNKKINLTNFNTEYLRNL